MSCAPARCSCAQRQIRRDSSSQTWQLFHYSTIQQFNHTTVTCQVASACQPCRWRERLLFVVSARCAREHMPANKQRQQPVASGVEPAVGSREPASQPAGWILPARSSNKCGRPSDRVNAGSGSTRSPAIVSFPSLAAWSRRLGAYLGACLRMSVRVGALVRACCLARSSHLVGLLFVVAALLNAARERW